MKMKVYFPGGKKVYADYKGFTIETDQPQKGGGDGSAPSPFDLFMTSIATCAGIYVLGFCQQRNIPADKITIEMDREFNVEKHLIGKITLTNNNHSDFPKQYKKSLVKVAGLCAVKKHLFDPPEFEIVTQDV